MRVLHLFKTYLPDTFTGVERVIWEIAEGTVKYGVTSAVMSLTAKGHPGVVAVGQHHSYRAKQDLYAASTGLSISAFRIFRELAREADIVHYHFPWPMMDALHLLVPPRRPTLVTYHSDVVRQKALLRLYRPLMHHFLQSVDRIVATSPNYLESSNVLRRYRAKTTVIPIGIREREQPSTDDLRQWQNRVGERFFLFVGALRYYKGLTFLLDAAKATGLPVVVVGAGELGDEIERAALPNVTLLRDVSDRDKEALLSLSGAFVFPSHLRSEAFGVALLEAARAGRPMISCEIGTGTSFVNVNTDTGIAVAPADPKALAAAMLMIWNDPNRAREMGRRARQRYEHMFTAERMNAAYFDLYERLAVGELAAHHSQL